MKTTTLLFISLTATAILTMTGCTADIPTVSLGIDDSYYIERMRKLPLHPALTGREYRWTLTRPGGSADVVSQERDYIFMQAEEGKYHVRLDIIDPDSPYSHEFTVTVMHEEVEYSPYISRVYEYCPAPGQFVNEMPRYEEGDGYADILQKAEESISGTNDIMITLGGYGGYVTFGFDHTVVNVPGEADFRIWGNCFYELTNPDRKGGSAEPGIVMVSYDSNCNGLPDDEWYELKGSDYGNPATRTNYSVTYFRPSAPKMNVEWVDSEGKTGIVKYLPLVHKQDYYYPAWITEPSYTLYGTCIPAANSVDPSTGYWNNSPYAWGYADNVGSDNIGGLSADGTGQATGFKLSNAVFADGSAIDLKYVDFVKVQVAVLAQSGGLGEISTEVSGFIDYSMR